jgi:hypothetical protein
MGFFSDRFKKGENPLPTCLDDEIGILKWSKDDEAWVGEYAKKRFALAYDRKSTPAPELISYAREVLQDQAWLESSLLAAKEQALKEYPSAFHEEIQQLTWDRIDFYSYKGVQRILASLYCGHDEGRTWRIEYLERKCEGIGFDD